MGVGRPIGSYCSTFQPEEDGAIVVMEKMEWKDWIQGIFRK